MKPRTKLQREVIRLSERYLFKLNESQLEYASQNFLDHEAFATKNKAYCMDCGEEVNKQQIKRKRVKCSCGQKLKVKTTRKRKHEQLIYFALAEIVGDFQVLRYFKLQSVHRIGWKKEVYCTEVLQHWINEEGKREVVARQHLQSYWNWSDSWSGNLEIRDKKQDRKYDVYHNFALPDSVFKNKYSMLGIDHNTINVSYLEIFRQLPNNSKAETLLKAKQYSLFSMSFNKYYLINRYWNSIKICIRNKKKVKDAGIFLDYLELLEHFRKDVRSPKYLFPKNLKREHDKLVEKKRLIQHREDQEKKKKKAIKHEKEYQEKIKQFLGLEFKEADLVVKVMESVQDFVIEGDLLHHCIYTNEYFKKENSLILSARKKDEVLETIEVDIEKMKVVQARGKYNSPSDHNEDFLRIVNNNINKIAERIAV